MRIEPLQNEASLDRMQEKFAIGITDEAAPSMAKPPAAGRKLPGVSSARSPARCASHDDFLRVFRFGAFSAAAG
jgi:hypothetical protein